MKNETKHFTQHSSNEMIREAIRAITRKGVVNSKGVIKGTAKVTGFVKKIHTDEDDELFGTIDVQEYADWVVSETEEQKLGYHEGVRLTAIQNDMNGYVVLPKLYSEVILTQDPETGYEYVTMFSQVDLIQLDSHDKISIGVREREEYNLDDEEAPDIQDLALTGVQTNTTYEKDSIVTSIQGGNKSDTVSLTIDSTQITQTIGDNKTVSTMNQNEYKVEHNKGSLNINDNDSSLVQGASKIKVTDGVTYIGDDNAVDDAVLGQELSKILSNLMGYLGQMMTPTMMGPQPPANVLSSFISLKAQIQAFASSHSGFLTKKVQVQK